ncbi:hypothetical protein Gromo_00282 [Candidatus Gromoviella agglomerans]|nr:hypothetical protein Gromo_00282 [Candidatus Gromoviella agglomerans]
METMNNYQDDSFENLNDYVELNRKTRLILFRRQIKRAIGRLRSFRFFKS